MSNALKLVVAENSFAQVKSRRSAKLASVLRNAVGVALIALTVGASAQTRGMQLSTIGVSGETIRNDILELKAMGADLIRFPIYFSVEPNVQTWIDKLNACLNVPGVTLIVTFHHPSPGHWGSEIHNIPDFLGRWRMFAAAYRGQNRLWFNLVNEPRPTYAGQGWRELAGTTARAIREIDPNRRIMIAAPLDLLSYLRDFDPPRIPNIVIEAHAWDWKNRGQGQMMPFPNQATQYTVADIRKRLDWVVQFRNRTGLPVVIGELGVLSRAHQGSLTPNPGAEPFMRHFFAEARGRQIPVIVHAYRREAWQWVHFNGPGEPEFSSWRRIKIFLREHTW